VRQLGGAVTVAVAVLFWWIERATAGRDGAVRDRRRRWRYGTVEQLRGGLDSRDKAIAGLGVVFIALLSDSVLF